MPCFYIHIYFFPYFDYVYLKNSKIFNNFVGRIRIEANACLVMWSLILIGLFALEYLISDTVVKHVLTTNYFPVILSLFYILLFYFSLRCPSSRLYSPRPPPLFFISSLISHILSFLTSPPLACCDSPHQLIQAFCSLCFIPGNFLILRRSSRFTVS